MQGKKATDRAGIVALVSAFSLWGVIPLYLRPLAAVPALEVMANRLVFCCAVVLGLLGARGELGAVRRALADRAVLRRLTASAILVSVNWLTYVWAVANGRVVEASLGYFINPLVNVMLGVVVLGERLRPLQWTAVALAAAGVVYLTVLGGALPWVALVLALSFGSYGLIRKTVGVDALVGLGAETLLLLPFGLAYLAHREAAGTATLFHHPALTALLVAGGPITAVPLALFSYGARRVPYSTTGIVQYIGPTLQLVIGVFLFGEPFSRSRAVGFAAIWTALALYAGHGVLARERERK